MSLMNFNGLVPANGATLNGDTSTESVDAKQPTLSEPDADTIKMFVGQVPRSWDDKECRELFEQFGPVHQLNVLRDKATQISRGCCFVTFYHRRDAIAAQSSLHNIKVLPGMHHPVQVKPADSENRNERKLFVGMLNKKLSEEEVKQMFVHCGAIEDCTILKDAEGKSKGCAFVTFASRVCATNAIRLMHHSRTMEGCSLPLVVKFADTQKDKEAKRNQPPGQPTSVASVGQPSLLSAPLAAPTNFGAPPVVNPGAFSALGQAYLSLLQNQAIAAQPQQQQPNNVLGAQLAALLPLLQQQQQQPPASPPQPLPGGNPTANVLALLGNVLAAGLGGSVGDGSTALTASPSGVMPGYANSYIGLTSSQSCSLASLAAKPTISYSSASDLSHLLPASNLYPTALPCSYGASFPIGQTGMNQLKSVAAGYSPTASGSGGGASAMFAGQPSLLPLPNQAAGTSSIDAILRQAYSGLHQYTAAGLPSNPPSMVGGGGGAGAMVATSSSSGSGGGKQTEGPDGANLFIYHLPQEFADADLAQTFAPFGTVLSAKVFIDKQTNLSKCFGFVSYDNALSAHAAIQGMNGFQVGTKRLKVQLKRSKGDGKPYQHPSANNPSAVPNGTSVVTMLT